MSICFELFTVNTDPNLKITGLYSDVSAYTYSDNCVHDFINLTYYAALNCHDKKKSKNKFLKKITNKFIPHFYKGKFFNISNYPSYYLFVDILCHGSGWDIFKTKYYKKKSWVYFAVTKRQMEKFFDRYFNYKDPAAIKYKEDFLYTWEREEEKGNNNLLFMCTF